MEDSEIRSKIYGQEHCALPRELVRATRLVHLHPGLDTEPIRCSLSVVDLEKKPCYAALSYAWGDPSDKATIDVEGFALLVPTNLIGFLKVLRHEADVVILWADAISMNQEDDAEKSRQIPLMSWIYREANQAHIWLGEFNEDWPSQLPQGARQQYEMAFSRTRDAALAEASRTIHEAFRDAGLPLPRKNSQLAAGVFDGDLRKQAVGLLSMIFSKDHHLHDLPFYQVHEADDGSVIVTANEQWLLVQFVAGWIVSRTWWTRLWALQEALLPQVDPDVHIGRWSCKLSDFLGSGHVGPYGDCCRSFISARFIAAAGGKRLWRIKRLALERKNFDGKPLDLESIRQLSEGRDATQLNDYALAVMGLLFPDSTIEIGAPLASQPTSLVYAKITRLLCTERQSLEHLSHVALNHKSLTPDKPSWAVDFWGYRIRIGARTISWDKFRAQGSSVHDAGATKPLVKSAQDSFLPVNGILVSEVDTMDDEIKLEKLRLRLKETTKETVTDMNEYLTRNFRLYTAAMKRRTQVIDSSVLQSMLGAYLRTTFQDHCHESNSEKSFSASSTLDIEPFPDEYIRSLTAWWEQFSSSVGKPLNLKDLVGVELRSDATVAKDPIDCQTVLEPLTADTHDTVWVHELPAEPTRSQLNNLKETMAWDRFFCTTDAVPGHGPLRTQPGDQVFVLAGCPCPVMLRRLPEYDDLKSGEQMDRPVYRFIGVCFLPTCMYGEAVREDSEWQPLYLR